MPPARLTPKQMQAACDRFNAKHPVGSEVTVYRGPVGENPITSAVRFPAEILSGHTPVVWVDGTAACIALTHVRDA